MTGDDPYFDDESNVVAISLPDNHETPEAELIGNLRDLGCIIPEDYRIHDAIEASFDQHGDRRAAEFLGVIFARLPGGRRGAELRAALLGAVDGSGQAMADSFGTSRQSWHARVKRLRERILKKR